MMSRALRWSVCGLWVLASLAWVDSPRARAQGFPQLLDINAEALDLYQNLDIDGARGKLEEGIALAAQNNYAGTELTQLYMTLGVVHVAGATDFDQGLAAFTSALCIQPDAQLDPLLSTPDVQQVFVEAQAQARASGCAASAPTRAVPMPQDIRYAPSGGPQVEDVECPPGMVCGETEGREDQGSFRRFFVNLQLGMGFGFAQPGMPTNSRPAFNEIFQNWDADLHPEPGVLYPRDPNTGMYILDGDGNLIMYPEPRFFFDDTSGWVPDADSFDDYENANVPRATTPVSAQCKADGTRTGPNFAGGPMFNQLEPSSYCVRVAQAGFVPGLALRLTPGYFIADTFALSLPMRFQLASSGGAFGAMQIGLRGELLFSKMKEATGFPISWFFGASYGEIQIKPPPRDASRRVPWIVAGPVALQSGFNVRYRIHPNFGLIASPEVALNVPDLLLHLEFAIGAEAAF